MSINKGSPSTHRKLISRRGNSHGTKWPVKRYARRLARRLAKQLAHKLQQLWKTQHQIHKED